MVPVKPWFLFMANKFSCQAAWKREEYVVTVQPVMIKLVPDVVKCTLTSVDRFRRWSFVWRRCLCQKGISQTGHASLAWAWTSCARRTVTRTSCGLHWLPALAASSLFRVSCCGYCLCLFVHLFIFCVFLFLSTLCYHFMLCFCVSEHLYRSLCGWWWMGVRTANLCGIIRYLLRGFITNCKKCCTLQFKGMAVL